MKGEHFKAVAWITYYGVFSGVLISSNNPIAKVIGIIHIILLIYYEYVFLQKIDLREEVKKAKNELRKYVDDTEKIKLEVGLSVSKIEKINYQIFDFINTKGFLTISERLKQLENSVEGNHGFGGIKDMKRDLEKIKEKLGIY